MAVFTDIKGFTARLIQKAKVRKGLIATLTALLIFQLYFVRELLAAELLFGLGFMAVIALVGFCYLVGTIGERSFELTEAGARVAAKSAKRGYASIEEISKKPFRHPHSESAQ